MWIGVLVPPLHADPGRPEARPIGRAALALAHEGIDVVFGHRAEAGHLWGMRAVPGAWVPVHAAPLAAAYDRFPSRSRATEHAALVAGLAGVPTANPPGLVALCADKVASQAVLASAGLAMPPIEADPSAFSERVAAWGAAFLKPRYGAFGHGVRRVVAGDPLPSRVEGGVPGVLEPAFLQRAVPPPAGWAGLTCRVLVQRLEDGSWRLETPVARRHRSDPVVNAARGAEVVPLVRAATGALDRVGALAEAAARALAAQPGGDLLVEIGADVVIDADGAAWLIEVNSRPRGRLEVLAAQDPATYGEAHVQACARPLRFLASTFLP